MFIVQFYNTGSKQWERSGNSASDAVYGTAEEAQTAVDSEEEQGGLRYRIAPAPALPTNPVDPELQFLRDQLSAIKSIINDVY